MRMAAFIVIEESIAQAKVHMVNPRSMPPSQPFSAVLLAGGQSSRMGVDKAGLVIDGEPLWQRQLAKLRATGAAEVFISGRIDGPYAGGGVEILEDTMPLAGPLAGIATAFRRIQYDWLLVLAVDLPDVSARLLAQLVAEAKVDGVGRVPAHGEWLQPLAAVFARACASIVEECLASEHRSMRRFFRLAGRQGLATARALSDAEYAQFRNLNTPADLAQ
jgi:molybdopterin-guanine dinucleotide biosynthesis protein A